MWHCHNIVLWGGLSFVFLLSLFCNTSKRESLYFVCVWVVVSTPDAANQLFPQQYNHPMNWLKIQTIIYFCPAGPKILGFERFLCFATLRRQRETRRFWYTEVLYSGPAGPNELKPAKRWLKFNLSHEKLWKLGLSLGDFGRGLSLVQYWTKKKGMYKSSEFHF